MKKSVSLLGCLLAVIFLSSLSARAQNSGLDYGSFDSFDPSGDFVEPAPATPQNTPPEYEPPVSGGYDRPAPTGFDLPEPGAYDPPAAETYAAPQPTGVDIADPRDFDNYPAAVEEYPAATEPDVAPAAEERPATPPPAPAPVADNTPPPVEHYPAATVPAASSITPTDYSAPGNWMLLPDSPDRSIDVFFLYPGACTRAGSGGSICSADDPAMRQKAQRFTGLQATAFEPIGNLYVPYYRQVNSSVFLGLTHQDRLPRLAVSVADAVAAFDHYIKRYNQGRPFILAAHGLGTAALLEGILGDYLKTNPEVRAKMVAAYALGYSVTGDYLVANDHLRFAERANDTGVIISYNTEAPDLKVHNPMVLPRAVAINPISWARSEMPVKAERSLGASLTAFDGDDPAEEFADARVRLRRGVVECSTVSPDDYTGEQFPRGAYPDGDYAFYYYDLRANAQARVDAFLSGGW